MARQTQLSIYLPQDLLDALDRHVAARQRDTFEAAKRAGASVVAVVKRSEIVRDALLAYLPAPQPPALSPDVDQVLP